jgi:citrate synthase
VLLISSKKSHKKAELQLEKDFVEAQSVLSVLPLYPTLPLVYDPGYVNTACCKSSICDIDGIAGKLSFRGYSIEELVEKSTFVEVAYLLIYGSLPDAVQLNSWTNGLTKHSFLHNNLTRLMTHFRYDAHPCGMFISAVSALGTFYPSANPALVGSDIFLRNPAIRDQQIMRILGKMPSIAAATFRNRLGRPFNAPMSNPSTGHESSYPTSSTSAESKKKSDPSAASAPPLIDPLSYTENFVYMLDRLSEGMYRPHPKITKLLDKIWILHAEHGLNCSTATMRQLASTGVDPYTAVAGATAALYGNLHGGANEAVLKMLSSIGSVDAVPSYLKKVKKEKRILFGFGHRVYKTSDPRAQLLKKIALEIFEVTGASPLWPIALALEGCVLKDEYFTSRQLFPNVDFYSGMIYQKLELPTDMFPVMFAIPLTAGWLAHWVEEIQTQSVSYEPKHIYVGTKQKNLVPISHRSSSLNAPKTSLISEFERRRSLGTSFDLNIPRSKL